MIQNKISIKNVIAKIYQDLNLNKDEDIGRFMEWIAEGLNKIGSYNQLEVVDSYKVKIHNYKAEIPCDLIYLQEVNYNGYQLDKGPSGNVIYPLKTTAKSYAVNEEKLHNVNFEYGKLYKFPNKETFIIQNGWFKTSFKDGDLTIKYDRLPQDEEGFPLIPDNESYRDALFWYCAYKYFYIKAIENDKYKWFYQDADIKFRYYIKQAGAESLMPDLFILENIKRNFLRLVPKINDYKQFYSNLNNTNG